MRSASYNLRRVIQWTLLIVGLIAFAALMGKFGQAQQQINPKTQIKWPAGCQVYNVADNACPPIGGINFRGTWSSSTTYAINDAVYDSGSTYVSLQNGNVNHNPLTSPTFWTLLVSPCSNCIVNDPVATQTLANPAGVFLLENNLSDENNFRSYNATVDSLMTLGDSQPAGHGLCGSEPCPTAYPATIAAAMGWANNNLALSSSACPDLMSLPALWSTPVTTSSHTIFQHLNNDSSEFALEAYHMDYARGCEQAIMAWRGTIDANKVLGQSSTVTYTGTWANLPQPVNIGKFTTQVGATATFTVFGPTVYFVGQKVVGNNGAYTLTVDPGTANEVDYVDPTSQSRTITNGIDVSTALGGTSAPYLVRIAGLENTIHTVVQTVTLIPSPGSDYVSNMWAQGVSLENSTSQGPNVFATPPFRYALSQQACTPGVGLCHNDVIVSAYRNQLISELSELAEDGLQVDILDLTNTAIYNPNDPTNGAQGDGIHASQGGADLIAAAQVTKLTADVTTLDKATSKLNGVYNGNGTLFVGLHAPSNTLGGLTSTFQFPYGTIGSATGYQTGALTMGYDGIIGFSRNSQFDYSVGGNGNFSKFHLGLSDSSHGAICTLSGPTYLFCSGDSSNTPIPVRALVFNASTGFEIGGAAPSGHCLIGNGSNYVDSTGCGGATIATTTLLIKGDNAGNGIAATGQDEALTAALGTSGNVIETTTPPPNPGNNNTVYGFGAAAAMTHTPNSVTQSAYENVILGYLAGQHLTTQNFSVLIGSQAGLNLTGTGTPVEDGINTFVGAGSGQALTTGGDNVAVGEDAMTSATVNSSSNTVMGTHAGDSPTTMNANVIIGHSAMSTVGTCAVIDDVIIGDSVTGAGCSNSENVIIGHQAMLSYTTPVDDVIIGSQAAAQATSENESVVIGFQAGANLTTGQQNTVMGYQAMGAQTAASSSIAIGAFSNSDNGANNIEIGGFTGAGSTASGQVVMGVQGCNGMQGNNNTCIGSEAKNPDTAGTGGNNTLIGETAQVTTNVSGAVQLGPGKNITSNSAQVYNIPLLGTTTFTASGCSVSTLVGQAMAGSFHSGTTGTCTVVITTGLTAPNGYSCFANDLTTTTDTVKQTATNATTATLAGVTVSGDVINFGCHAY